jgi:hypothetical protein
MTRSVKRTQALRELSAASPTMADEQTLFEGFALTAFLLAAEMHATAPLRDVTSFWPRRKKTWPGAWPIGALDPPCSLSARA